jgi:hypothetical protein
MKTKTRLIAESWKPLRILGLLLTLGLAIASKANAASDLVRASAQYNGHSYALYERLYSPISWLEADQLCKSMGGHLVCIHDRTENQFVVGDLLSTTDKRTWLGAYKDLKQKKWVWVDGTDVVYSDWRRELLAEDKFCRGGFWNDGGWRDFTDQPQFHVHGFVCEWDDIRALPTPGSPSPSPGLTPPAPSPPTTTTVITTTAPAKNLPLTASIARVNALLITQVNAAEFAGFSQPFMATAIETGGDDPLELKFNQPVGLSMKRAVEAAVRGLQVKYNAWPHGYSVSLAFQDKYIAKDGPSAAVACALLLDTLINNTKMDPKFAVTGDINADLKVQPVGGVPSKIRGATKDGCTVVAIPAANRTAIEDMIILDGIRPLAKIQIFTLDHFDQARQLSLEDRDPALQQSIDDFAILQAGATPAADRKALLQGILERTPNHLSAELILRGPGRTKLSLVGSFQALDRSFGPFVEAIQAGKPESIAESSFRQAMIDLNNIERKIDPRTVDFYRKLKALYQVARRHAGQNFNNRSQYEAALTELNDYSKRANDAWDKLRKNPEIVEELEE